MMSISVLIVAECNVNYALDNNSNTGMSVLIVAECNVNFKLCL